MYSKVKIAGHPLHPMLVAFPMAFYTATLIGFGVYWVSGDAFWFRLGFVANVGGVVTALVAAFPGFIDWAFGVPTGSPAKTTGLQHALLMVLALALFAVNAGLQWNKAELLAPEVGASVILPLLGFATTMAGGFLGWKMIGTHHVGIDLTPEQERLEPRANARAARHSLPPLGHQH